MRVAFARPKIHVFGAQHGEHGLSNGSVPGCRQEGDEGEEDEEEDEEDR